MTAIELRVDDRVILVSAIAVCAGYVLLQWHRAQFEWRRAPEAAADDSDAQTAREDPTNTEAAWVSRLLERHFACESGQEAPFADLPLVQAIAEANAAFGPSLTRMVEKHCVALTDFTGERGEPAAINLGCGVGGTALALAECFPSVLAVDASQRCIDAAKALQEQGCLSFRTITAAGPVGVRRMAQLPPDVDAGRITYLRADPEAFTAEVDGGAADAVVMAGLLTRLPRPAVLLASLRRLLRPQGVVVIATDYHWDAITPQHEQLLAPGPSGGQACAQKSPRQPRELAVIMEEQGFVLAAEADLPAAVRLSDRRHAVSVQHVTLWQWRGGSCSGNRY